MTRLPPRSPWFRSGPAAAGTAPLPWTRRSACAWICAWAWLAGPGAAIGATWQGAPARQVVVFGVIAIPGSTEMDPKIAPVVQAQLRRLLPNHGFRMKKIKGERVTANSVVKCDFGDDASATVRLLNPLDPNGKIQMKFELTIGGVSQFQTIVATPPDQFNFFDKALPDGNRLLVGVGAR